MPMLTLPFLSASHAPCTDETREVCCEYIDNAHVQALISTLITIRAHARSRVGQSVLSISLLSVCVSSVVTFKQLLNPAITLPSKIKPASVYWMALLFYASPALSYLTMVGSTI